eukprot:TRINITY_DN37245_c0_g1_i1.p1 TRINITY_DN37245_c0_g1~~TRINITY_DN37245_c0_g1_i1.p1  ORF type:complete len:240 (+),score=46.99 TRINITY_DN37245_c0_g1_i1:200-919(+)
MYPATKRPLEPPTPLLDGLGGEASPQRRPLTSCLDSRASVADSLEPSRAGGRASTLGARSRTTARETQASMRSNASLEDLQRRKILNAMSREREAAQREFNGKRWGESAIADFHTLKDQAAQRKRDKQLALPPHLRSGSNPMTNGCPASYTTQTGEVLLLPTKMAVDPKWSTDLKRTNDRVGQRIKYERGLSASVTGSISPELPYMPPKQYVSNPATPFFEPGVRRTPGSIKYLPTATA